MTRWNRNVTRSQVAKATPRTRQTSTHQLSVLNLPERLDSDAEEQAQHLHVAVVPLDLQQAPVQLGVEAREVVEGHRVAEERGGEEGGEVGLEEDSLVQGLRGEGKWWKIR